MIRVGVAKNCQTDGAAGPHHVGHGVEAGPAPGPSPVACVVHHDMAARHGRDDEQPGTGIDHANHDVMDGGYDGYGTEPADQQSTSERSEGERECTSDPSPPM